MITKSVARRGELKSGDPELLFGLGLAGLHTLHPTTLRREIAMEKNLKEIMR